MSLAGMVDHGLFGRLAHGVGSTLCFGTLNYVSDLGLLFVVFTAFVVQTSRMGTFVQVDNTCAVLCWVKISFLLLFFLFFGDTQFPGGGVRSRDERPYFYI
jgi:hypothetical protein